MITQASVGELYDIHLDGSCQVNSSSDAFLTLRGRSEYDTAVQALATSADILARESDSIQATSNQEYRLSMTLSEQTCNSLCQDDCPPVESTNSVVEIESSSGPASVEKKDDVCSAPRAEEHDQEMPVTTFSRLEPTSSQGPPQVAALSVPTLSTLPRIPLSTPISAPEIESQRAEESHTEAVRVEAGEVFVTDTVNADIILSTGEIIRPHEPFTSMIQTRMATQHSRLIRVPVMNNYVEPESGEMSNQRIESGSYDGKQPQRANVNLPSTVSTEILRVQGAQEYTPIADIYPPPSVTLQRNSLEIQPQAYAIVEEYNMGSTLGVGPTVLAIEHATLEVNPVSRAPAQSMPLSSIHRLEATHPYLPRDMRTIAGSCYPPTVLPPYCQTMPQTRGGPIALETVISSFSGSPTALPFPRRQVRSLEEETPGTCMHCWLACFIGGYLCLFSLLKCCCCSFARPESTFDRRSDDGDPGFFG